jgi:malonate transporter and related proteins
MEHIFSSLIPIFALIIFGYLFKKISFPSHDFWPMADKLTYYILMPSLLILTLSQAKFENNSFELILSSTIAIFLTLLTLVIFNKFNQTNSSSFTSVVQGGIRFNTYVFLALSGSIFGSEGLVIAAIIISFAIPILNIFCISIFAIYSDNQKINILFILKSIFKNPLIIASIIGVLINILGFQMPLSLENFLKILSAAALPLGLLSIGYALVLKDIKSAKKDMLVSIIAKFIVLPAFIFFISKYLELDALAISVLVLFAIMPTAPSSFILARELKGDLQLITSIITVQTILATIFLTIFLNYFV